MKLFLNSLLSLCLLNIYFTKSQNINIVEYGGWFEKAYVKWQTTENIDSFNVYYSGEGIVNRKIDKQLIRYYGTYYRADIIGIKPGKYIISIVPVINGIEGSASATSEINVLPHDRSGFAFVKGRIPGAYKADGTPKDNAVILYITEKNKNTISLNVTGASSNPCVGLQAILDGFKKGKDNRPLIIRFIGKITDLDYMYNGDLVVENSNNSNGYITLEGVGDDAVIYGWGIRLKNATNIEIRNLGFMYCNSSEGDAIGLQQNNQYIWIHNCDFFYGAPGSDADQIKGDGTIDCKSGSTYITISYNHFWDTGKTHLLGMSESSTSGLYATYHHNWYDHSDSRHPRVRYYSTHVYNNYYDGISKYCIGATMGCSIFAEANYFRNCKYPMLISMQGSDVFNPITQTNDYVNMPTFSKEDGGIIKAYNNYMTGNYRFVAYGDPVFPNSKVDFDAVVVSSRNDKISDTIKTYRGGYKYNNFDTDPSIMYSYQADEPEAAKNKVMQYAGRINGGDLKWTFNNAVDDYSYDIISGLKNAIVNYTSKLVSCFDGVTTDSSYNNNNNNNNNSTPNDSIIIHNFTISGKTSTFFNIQGNLSDSKGTVVYEGQTLTWCLKIESTTSISFAIPQNAVLTLVFNNDFNGRIKINGTNYTANNGILTIDLSTGNYQITKTDVANLFYIKLILRNNQVPTEIPLIIADENIQIYPVPADNFVVINSNLKIDGVKIYSINGKLIANKTLDNKNYIDISNLQKGLYIIEITTNKNVHRYKFIKQ